MVRIWQLIELCGYEIKENMINNTKPAVIQLTVKFEVWLDKVVVLSE